MTVIDQVRIAHAELDRLDVPREHDGMTFGLKGRIALALTGSTVPGHARLAQVDNRGEPVLFGREVPAEARPKFAERRK